MAKFLESESREIRARDLHPVKSIGARIGITIAVVLLGIWWLTGRMGYSIAASNPGAFGGDNMGTLPAGTPNPSIYYQGSWSDIQHGSFSPIWGSQSFHSSSY